MKTLKDVVNEHNPEYEEKSDRYKNYREKIIEGAKIMQNICEENGLTKNCENCSIYDICSKFDDANLDIGFVPEYIGKLPEV